MGSILRTRTSKHTHGKNRLQEPLFTISLSCDAAALEWGVQFACWDSSSPHGNPLQRSYVDASFELKANWI